MCRCLANSLESFSDLADIFSDSDDHFSDSGDHGTKGKFAYFFGRNSKIIIKFFKDDGEDFESSFENVDEEILTYVCVCVCVRVCDCACVQCGYIPPCVDMTISIIIYS